MGRARKIKDSLLQGLTYASALLASLMLLLIFYFVLSRGLPGFSFKLLVTPYWSDNLNIAFEEQETHSFDEPALEEGEYFVKRYGVVLADSLDAHKMPLVLIRSIDEHSPLKQGTVTTAGPRKGEVVDIAVDSNINSLSMRTPEGKLLQMGSQKKNSAQEIAQAMEFNKVEKGFIQSPGGGIQGSLKATLILIALSLLIALPIGISAAIYLREYAGHGKLASLMRSSIEVLAGVPSIIFGLMGMTVLFPVTQMVGIRTVSILLGALTMAVVLLPVIIRQTEESLKTVPDGLRDASLSLGATRAQTIFRVMLPGALPGILTATLLSVSRIIGESAALIYTMGTYINDKPRVDQGATTLAVQIWSLMSGEQPNFELSSTISIMILIMVLLLNLGVKLISYHLRKKWSAS